MTLSLRETEGRRLLQRVRKGGDGQKEIFREKEDRKDENESKGKAEKGLNAKIGEKAREEEELERDRVQGDDES